MSKAILYNGSGTTQEINFNSYDEAIDYFKSNGCGVEFLSETDLKWFRNNTYEFTPITIKP